MAAMENARTEDNVLNFVAHRRKNTAAHFTRTELNQLLGLYAEKSKTGEWRHSTLDQRYGLIAYSVYQDPLERPVYTIIKFDRAHREKGRYVLYHRRRRLKQCQTMGELLMAMRGMKTPQV